MFTYTFQKDPSFELIFAEITNIHIIKPIDKEAVLTSISKTGCVVTAEEPNRIGGLGDSLARVIVGNHLVP